MECLEETVLWYVVNSDAETGGPEVAGYSPNGICGPETANAQPIRGRRSEKCMPESQKVPRRFQKFIRIN